MIGYLLSDDLIFTSRITGTARDLGFQVSATRTLAELATRVQQEPPRCVIVDLANPGLIIADLVKLLRTGDQQVYIVAYGSHVDTATLKTARDAGCDVVWPRSKFVEELPRAMPAWFDEGKETGEA